MTVCGDDKMNENDMFEQWENDLEEHGKVVVSFEEYEVFKVYARVYAIDYKSTHDYFSNTVTVERW